MLSCTAGGGITRAQLAMTAQLAAPAACCTTGAASPAPTSICAPAAAVIVIGKRASAVLFCSNQAASARSSAARGTGGALCTHVLMYRQALMYRLEISAGGHYIATSAVHGPEQGG